MGPCMLRDNCGGNISMDYHPIPEERGWGGGGGGEILLLAGTRQRNWLSSVWATQ